MQEHRRNSRMTGWEYAAAALVAVILTVVWLGILTASREEPVPDDCDPAQVAVYDEYIGSGTSVADRLAWRILQGEC